MDLSGKKALVTGGSRGIGASIALALAERGADVAFSYERSADKAAQVVAAIEAKGRRGLAIQASSGDPEAIVGLVDQAVAALGGIDIVVNNAAVARGGRVADLSLDDIQLMLDVNVRGAVLLVKAAIPHMADGGRVILVGSSVAERVLSAETGVYAATKAAQVALAGGLAHELGARGITANVVQPGATDTDMNPADGPASEMMRAMTPLGRYGAAEDVAAAVVFLASPAARQITGTTITVDGGLNA